DTETRKNDVYQYLVRESYGIVGEGTQQGALGEEIGDHQADAHLLKQREDQLHKKRSSEFIPKKAAGMGKCDQDLVL
ncbi:hypothetical protein, partial [Aeromonas salmonicida]|uniref:hypothetical protein n=1 Tax=Aeromonas salmonicida TaxID=645 RepID=UPI001A8C5965